jgi:hypothetical protein
MNDTAVFRFDALRHDYIDPGTGEQFPHITGMLEDAGYIDTEWFTEESRIRGQIVHRLTGDYDLGALDVPSCTSIHRGYLLAHVELMKILRPEILAVEEPLVHPRYRYGGRPDRVWRLDGAIAVPEIKSGDPEDSHGIQTALQAILISLRYGLPAPSILRYGVYLKGNGRYKLEKFKDRADFDKALRVIKECCPSSRSSGSSSRLRSA